MLRNCKVCYGEHNEEIHAATLSVREWFRERVERSLIDPFEIIAQEPEIADAA